MSKPNASYIVSDGKAYAKDEMGSIIKKIINKQTLKINLPRAPILASVFCLEKIYGLFGSMPFLHTEKIKEITAANWSCDSTGLWEELKMGPIYSMQGGVTETTNWYKENGWMH